MSLLSRTGQDSQGLGMTSQRARDRLVERLRVTNIRNPRVLEALRSVPRHLFVDEALASRAYEDTALPIGLGQTISQPYVVARMTEIVLDERQRLGKVLEVGTGSGYQAAVLAQVADQVYTVERIDELLHLARRRFRRLGLNAIRSRFADGRAGWPEHGPFDAIVVTAGSAELAEELAQQLAVDGVLVAPLGEQGQQRLVRIRRTAGGWDTDSMDAVSFVPLLGGTL